MKTNNFGYLTDTQDTQRHAIKYYLEIDSYTFGTLTFCQPGEGISGAREYLAGAVGFDEGENQVGDCQLVFTRDILDVHALESLCNKVCRIYRYRTIYEKRELLREGRIWDPVTFNSLNQTVSYQVVGNLGLDLEGEVPDRRFSLLNYKQLPEEYQNRGVPIVFGNVSGWTPVLAKAGGWGYLSEDVPAQEGAFDGQIPLSNNRGMSFANPTASTLLGIAIGKFDHQILVDSNSGFCVDSGSGWVMFNEAELVRCCGTFLTTYLYPVYRGMAYTDPLDHPENGSVKEVGLCLIDDELFCFLHRGASMLFGCWGGINKPAAPHYAGALVREYNPTYLWVISGFGVKSGITKRDVRFFVASQDNLIANPFDAETTVDNRETGIELNSTKSISYVKIEHLEYSTKIIPDDYATDDLTLAEAITMDSAAAENDDTANWSDTGNAIDGETVDPYSNPTTDPSTFAAYDANLTDTYIEFNEFYLHSNTYGIWTDEANMLDEDVATNAHCNFQVLPGQPQDTTILRINLEDSLPAVLADVTLEGNISYEAGIDFIETYIQYGPDGNGYIPLSFHIPTTNIGGETTITASYRISDYPGEWWSDLSRWNNWNDWLRHLYFRFSARAGANQFSNDREAHFGIARIVLSGTSHGVLKLQNTTAITNKATTLYTQIAVFVQGTDSSWQINYDNAWGSDSWYEFSGQGWVLLTIPGSDAWSADVDWQKYIRIRPTNPGATGMELYDVRMYNIYMATGAWSLVGPAFDGNPDTYANLCMPSGTNTIYLEIKRKLTVSGTDTIKRVRIGIRYKHNLEEAYIGIALTGDETNVTEWQGLGSASDPVDKYIDVTNSADGPGGDSWAWADFECDGSGEDLAIYLKCYGTEAQEFLLYEIWWDIIAESSQIDPRSTPMVVDTYGVEDSIGGNYGEGLIDNPAYIEKWLINKCLASANLDNDAYDTLAAVFDTAGISAAGVVRDVEAIGDFLTKFRQQFGYCVIDRAGSIAPVAWPDSTASSEADLHPGVIRNFSWSLTPMSEVCNFPIADYNPKYYNSDRDRSILAGLVQTDTRARIKKQWSSNLVISNNEQVKKLWKNRMEVSEIQSTHPTEYALAAESFRQYGAWFKQIFQFDWINDSTVMKAVLAKKLLRYAFQRHLFEFECDADPADTLHQYSVVTIGHLDIPKIPGKTTWNASATFDDMWSLKAVILSIRPQENGTRMILAESL